MFLLSKLSEALCSSITALCVREHSLLRTKRVPSTFLVLQLVTNRGLESVPGRTNQYLEGPQMDPNIHVVVLPEIGWFFKVLTLVPYLWQTEAPKRCLEELFVLRVLRTYDNYFMMGHSHWAYSGLFCIHNIAYKLLKHAPKHRQHHICCKKKNHSA